MSGDPGPPELACAGRRRGAAGPGCRRAGAEFGRGGATARAARAELPAPGGRIVVASDKTGTLTRNEMTVQVLRTPRSAIDLSGGDSTATPTPDIEELLRAGVLCNDATPAAASATGLALGDPTEIALLTAAQRCGVDPERERATRPRLAALPFDADRKLMATVHRRPD